MRFAYMAVWYGVWALILYRRGFFHERDTHACPGCGTRYACDKVGSRWKQFVVMNLAILGGGAVIIATGVGSR